MAEPSLTCSCRGWVHRSCRSRLLRVVAVGVVIGLGTAGPALASDGRAPPIPPVPEPVVPVLEVPQPELPTVPVPDPLAAPGPDPVSNPLPEADVDTETTSEAPLADPAAEANAPDTAPDTPPAAPPDVTTSTQSDGGNVNVSVRVDSPGEEAPVVQDGPDPAVVSPPAQPDITPVAGIVASEPDEPGSTDSPDAFPATPTGDSTNTNVTVRVSSPGDNDPVTQTTASADPHESGGEDGATPGDTVESTPDPLSDSSQYQDDNSQYQSPESSPEDAPWNWTWTLTVCDGNVLSVSDETGNKSSRDWTWNWIWNWTCDEAPASSAAPAASATDTEDRGSGVPQSGPANVNVSIRVLSPATTAQSRRQIQRRRPLQADRQTRRGRGPGRSRGVGRRPRSRHSQARERASTGTGTGSGCGTAHLRERLHRLRATRLRATVAATADRPQNCPRRTTRHRRALPFRTGAAHRRRSRSRASPVPESLAEWVSRVSWVTPRTAGTAFPTWLTDPLAPELDTTIWEAVPWPALRPRAGRRSPDRRDRRWESISPSRSRASFCPGSRSLRCRSCRH